MAAVDRDAAAGGGKHPCLDGDLIAALLLLVWLTKLALGRLREFVQGGAGTALVSWRGHVSGLGADVILVSLSRYTR